MMGYADKDGDGMCASHIGPSDAWGQADCMGIGDAPPPRPTAPATTSHRLATSHHTLCCIT